MGGTGHQLRSARGSTTTGLDEEALEQLINKVCSNFTQQLDKKLDTRIKALETKITQACNSFTTLNDQVSKNAVSVDKLTKRIETLEQGSKKNTLRISGLPESGTDNLARQLLTLFGENLKIPCRDSDLDYFFRIGEISDEKPRTVIVRFTNNTKKNAIILARKVLKGTPFSIYEDLTAERYAALAEAKKKFGNNKAWSSGGTVYYWNAQQNRKIVFYPTKDNNYYN